MRWRGNDRGGFNLDPGIGLDQACDLHNRHGGKIPADQFAIGLADRGQAGDVFVAAGDVPGHSHDVFGTGPGLGEDREGVGQHLAELGSQIVSDDALFGIEGDHAGGKHQPTGRGDAVGIASRPRPAGGSRV